MTVYQVLMEMSNITVSKLNGRRLPKRAGSKSGCVLDGSKATKPQSTHAHDTHVVGLCPEPLVMPGQGQGGALRGRPLGRGGAKTGPMRCPRKPAWNRIVLMVEPSWLKTCARDNRWSECGSSVWYVYIVCWLWDNCARDQYSRNKQANRTRSSLPPFTPSAFKRPAENLESLRVRAGCEDRCRGVRRDGGEVVIVVRLDGAGLLA